MNIHSWSVSALILRKVIAVRRQWLACFSRQGRRGVASTLFLCFTVAECQSCTRSNTGDDCKCKSEYDTE